MATRFEIVDGPSKWDLMLAFFDYTCQHPRVVDFKIDDKEVKIGWIDRPRIVSSIVSLPFHIDTLSREDRSGETWNWKGVCSKIEHSKIEYSKAKGFFSTKTRKGWLEIEGF